jgi:aryl-alcohol dehydrogenase-like predicted oxidoreductase
LINVTSVILGASRLDQLADTLAAADFALDGELKKQLDELTSEYWPRRRGAMSTAHRNKQHEAL